MPLSVGLLGFGTVGQSVARLIVERTDGLLRITRTLGAVAGYQEDAPY